MSSKREVNQLQEIIARLIEEWGAQISEFRRLSLEAEGRTEETRMRAKADTLHYSRQELILALENSRYQEEENHGKISWPGLSGIINSKTATEQ